jgi:hypothetical protein
MDAAVRAGPARESVLKWSNNQLGRLAIHQQNVSKKKAAYPGLMRGSDVNRASNKWNKTIAYLHHYRKALPPNSVAMRA